MKKPFPVFDGDEAAEDFVASADLTDYDLSDMVSVSPRLMTPDRRTAVTEALTRLAPRLPEFEGGVVVDRALASPGLRQAAPETAARLALIAYARHVFTDYDDLLAEGYDRDSARHFILDALNEALEGWGAKPVPEEPDGEETGPDEGD